MHYCALHGEENGDAETSLQIGRGGFRRHGCNPAGYRHGNLPPLVEAIDALGLPRFGIGYHVDSGIITGLDEADSGIPAFFHGSTRIAELASASGFGPGAFFSADWFDPQQWISKRDDLLNPEQRLSTIGDLRRNWLSEPIFVKSVEANILTGMVLEGPYSRWWLKEYAHIDDKAATVISPAETVAQEWRFFIADGLVVAGSQYKHDGVKRICEPLPRRCGAALA